VESAPANRLVAHFHFAADYAKIHEMTKLLEQAVDQARQLPESEQDAIARLVLDEIESERKWDRLFAKSPEKLSRLADQAWAEQEAGLSEELDPDGL
jgi:hypothetical protein